eukprot:evm.model.scf_209.9 EVM.evm.TU.scf_209.9   scf_209:54383-63697(-)
MPEYLVRGVPVQFPYDAYEQQVLYMGKVVQALEERRTALLESPTGTGKTLCLLCATLAWTERYTAKNAAYSSQRIGYSEKAKAAAKAVGLGDPTALAYNARPLIIYASRTHSQLAQVMKELKKTDYRVKSAVLGSRSQQCIHPEVSKYTGNAINLACRRLVRQRRCSWKMKTEPGGMVHLPEEIVDIEDLNRFGHKERVCPYYLSRMMAENANIVFVPYQYLIDERKRESLGLSWEGSIIIFDEAHNLEQVCAGSASFDLTVGQVTSCMEEVARCIERASSGSASQPQSLMVKQEGESSIGFLKQLESLLSVLQRMANAMHSWSIPSQGRTLPGKYIFDFLNKCGIGSLVWNIYNKTLGDVAEMLSEEGSSGRHMGKPRNGSSATYIAEIFSLAFRTEDPPSVMAAPLHRGYRVHQYIKKLSNGDLQPTLGFWCFVPGTTMNVLSGLKVRSMILTSGTISPMKSFAAELFLDEPLTLENRHIINPSQVCVGILPLGPSGVPLNFSYKTRDSPQVKDDLGNALVNFGRIVPGGVLVFFSSYWMMESFIDRWKSSRKGGNSVWEGILRHKHIVVEPKESAQFQQAFDDYKRKLDIPTHNGCMMFSVFRGKVTMPSTMLNSSSTRFCILQHIARQHKRLK